jgi:hypothetical protein
MPGGTELVAIKLYGKHSRLVLSFLNRPHVYVQNEIIRNAHENRVRHRGKNRSEGEHSVSIQGSRETNAARSKDAILTCTIRGRPLARDGEIAGW